MFGVSTRIGKSETGAVLGANMTFLALWPGLLPGVSGYLPCGGRQASNVVLR